MKPSLKLSATLALIIFSFSASAQTFSPDSLAKKFHTFSTWCSPEKLYLHIDRTYFTTDETLWFEGYLSNAIKRSLVPESNYIYVELLKEDGEAASRVKVKRTEDGFPGYLYLSESLKTGWYTLRAYTMWQLNGAPEYMFNQRIKILGADAFPEEERSKGIPEYDVTFYPEGGRYFAGVKSTMCFKGLASDGRSIDVRGFLAEENGSVIFPIFSRYDGMGLFNFTPKEGVRYYLETEDGKRFFLPEPSKTGASVGIRNVKGNLLAYVNGIAPGRFFLAVRNSQEINVIAELTLDGRTRAFQLEKELCLPGINHALIVDEAGNIASERLFFVYDARVPVATITPDTYTPKPHGLINTKVTLKDPSGAPVDGKFSISITRGSFKNHQQADGIVSYRYLSSELKGNINTPSYYFDESRPLKERATNLDLLMVIQGWRYYDVETLLNPAPSKFKIKFLKEMEQSIRGRIDRRGKNDKMPRNFIFSVLIPKLNFKRFITVDQARFFTIDSLDFEEGTDFLINVSRTGIGGDYIPKWAGDTYAPAFKYYPAPGKVGAVVEKDKVPLVSEVVSVDTLSAAVVTASQADAFSEYADGHTVTGNELKMYADRTLIEYLTLRTPQFEYDGETMYNKNLRTSGPDAEETEDEDQAGTGGGEIDFEAGGGSGTVKLIVDDFENPWWSYEFVRCDEIEAVLVSTQPDALYNSPGGLVVLKLKPGASVSAVQTRPSLLYFVPLGYQKPKAFYSPRYDLGDKREGFDHRNTIFWSPAEKTLGGTTKISFSNTDQMDYPYIVRIEGLTESGVPFSAHTKLDFIDQSY